MSTDRGQSTANTAFLLELTSQLLSAPLSLKARAECLVEQLVPCVAPFAAVFRNGAPGLQRLASSPALDVELTSAPSALRVLERGEPESAALCETAHVESFVMVPLSTREEQLGVLVVGFGARERAREQASRIAEIARLAGFALEKAALHDAVEHARRARDDILAIVAHDLRNPLTTARLAAARLETTTDPQQLAEGARVVKRSVERALTLVEDLLDLSVVESGGLSLNRANVPVDALLNDALTLLGPLCARAGLKLNLHAEAGVGTVYGDAKRILQVLSNLIGNAVKFTPRGGSVTLAVTCANGAVCFAVTDTGRGIPPEVLPRVFDRFFQVTHGEKRGAGLGLPIAKGIVERHGGTITVESVLGRGTTFAFTIPTA